MRPAIFLYFTLCCLLGCGQSLGQQNEDEKQAVRFSCLYWEGLPKEDLYYREKNNFRKLTFKKASRSNHLELRGMDFFELYRMVKNPQKDQPPYQLVAKAKIPPSFR